MRILFLYTLLVLLSFIYSQFSNNEQAFLEGVHHAMGLAPNPRLFRLINSNYFNLTSLQEGLLLLKRRSREDKEAGVHQIRDTFFNFSQGLFEELIRDKNFEKVLNYTLTDFWDEKTFTSKSEIYNRRTGRSASLELDSVRKQLLNGEYRGSGWTFGNSVFNMRKVALREEQQNSGSSQS